MQENNFQINLITFGCRLNTLESELIRKYATIAKLNKSTNVFIFNTCAVTKEAERQVAQSVRKYKKNNPDSIIILTGCSANASKEKYFNMPEIDFVIGNKEKCLQETYNNIKNILFDENCCNKKIDNKIFVGRVENSIKDNGLLDYSVNNFTDRTRAFIQIQQGCQNRCTFCIIPYLRGNSISFTKQQIFQQIKTVVDNGYKEIVITGIDIASYGDKRLDATPLADLLIDIIKSFPEIERIRLSSLDPAYNYDKLLNLAKDSKKILPHFHLSLQHASNNVLRLMGRRHTREQALKLCKKIKKKIGKHVAIGADIITGFPNESENDFKSLIKFIKQAKITHLHTFVYSPRPKTFAFDHFVDNVPKQIAKQRARIIRNIAKNNMRQLMRISEKKIQYVLLENNGTTGYTENYIKCNVHNKEVNKNQNNDITELKPNNIVKVKINKKRIIDNQELDGVVIK